MILITEQAINFDVSILIIPPEGKAVLQWQYRGERKWCTEAVFTKEIESIYMPHHHFQGLHPKRGPPKCSSLGSLRVLVSKSHKQRAQGEHEGLGIALAVRSSKLLRVICIYLPVGRNSKGGLGSHLRDQALRKPQPEMASSFSNGFLLL